MMKIEVYITDNIYTYLNYLTDGFSNMNYKKIVNLFVHIQIRVFPLESEKIPAIKHSTLKSAKQVYAKAIFWFRRQMQQHNSWAIDIISVIQAF